MGNLQPHQQQMPSAMMQQQQQFQMQQQQGQQQIQMGQQQGQQQQMPMSKIREVIWEGELHWKENTKVDGSSQEKTEHKVVCSVTSSKESGTGAPEVSSSNWPRMLIMQLIPKTLVQTIGGVFFKNSKSVLFHPEPSEALDALTRVLSTGFAGCVHFAKAQHCDIKVLILLYSNEKKTYLGFIPNDQTQFVERIRKVIQQQKMEQAQNQQSRQMQLQQQQQGMMGQQQQQPQMMMGGGMSNPTSSTLANMGGGTITMASSGKQQRKHQVCIPSDNNPRTEGAGQMPQQQMMGGSGMPMDQSGNQAASMQRIQTLQQASRQWDTHQSSRRRHDLFVTRCRNFNRS